jgi:hypothetical protein
MRRVKVEDVVFSYANGVLGAVGIAEGECLASERPQAFGKSGEQWSRDGWQVAIRWSGLAQGIRPQEHLDDIVPLLPTKYSPIRANGYGNQKFYLLEISELLGKKLLALGEKLGNQTIEVVEDVVEAVKDDLEELKVRDQDIPLLEREQLIKARRGQGLFRLNLERFESACRVTGVRDRRFLIASHIKPWRDSSNKEKLDGNNGLLLSPHVDKLFDRGWISFSDDGHVLCANVEIERLLVAWGLNAAKNVGAFNARQRAYLDHHRTVTFRKG